MDASDKLAVKQDAAGGGIRGRAQREEVLGLLEQLELPAGAD
jgi:hypothetical protein